MTRTRRSRIQCSRVFRIESFTRRRDQTCHSFGVFRYKSNRDILLIPN